MATSSGLVRSRIKTDIASPATGLGPRRRPADFSSDHGVMVFRMVRGEKEKLSSHGYRHQELRSYPSAIHWWISCTSSSDDEMQA
ncbi:hypothetical protein NL676_034088 [Syzygium grande]|nr:hypothetical protein NL676_034088 [Syzygium grande]